jgi:tRNA wybutosine-synthesizing protein 1
LLKSLEYLSKKKQRTCIRLTLIKSINDIEPENYAKLIRIGSPDFIEVKAYMHVGASRLRLKIENMPLHHEVVAFTKELIKSLPEYEIVSEHKPSRVLMLAKKKFIINGKWNTWIDFEKWNELVNSDHTPETMQYLLPTPESTGAEETIEETTLE